MLQVWTAVKVKTEDHPRFGQAGSVHATDREDHPDEVVVKFDSDNALEAVALVDLVTL